MLVLPKSKHQCVQDEAQVRHQLCACLLFQSGKCALRKMCWVRKTYKKKLGEYKRAKQRKELYLQAASCTLLLPSRIRLSSSVMRGLR